MSGKAQSNGHLAQVSVPQLADIFGVSKEQVRKRLRTCEPLAKKTSGYVYSLPEAAGFLVAPKVDVRAAMRTMKPSELPAELQSATWAAQLKRLQFEEKAGQLWSQEDIVSFMTAMFSRLRASVLLWPDTLAERAGLDEDGRAEIEKHCDRLLEELCEEVEELARAKSPRSVLARIFDIVPDEPPEIEEDEDEDGIEDLF